MKYTIPILLASTIIVAGIFAFSPVEEARTVHTTIQASTTKIISSVSGTTTVNDGDITITCPAGSDGCQILEVYAENTTAFNVILIDIDATVNSKTIATLVDINPDLTIGNVAVQVVAQAGGIALDSGDSIILDADAGQAGNRYFVTVIGIVEGDQTDFDFTVP